MIKVLYFASIREQLNCSEEELESDSNSQTVSQLKQLLASRDSQWQSIFTNNNQLMSSVNQEVVKDVQIINDGDEVAFFPQVTGG